MIVEWTKQFIVTLRAVGLLPFQSMRWNYGGCLGNLGHTAPLCYTKVKQMHLGNLADPVLFMKMAGGLSSAVGCIDVEVKQEESVLVWAACMGRMYPVNKSLVANSDALRCKLEKIRSTGVSNRIVCKAKKAAVLAALLGRFCELDTECPKLREKLLICGLVF